MARISVIVPVYQVEAYLDRCVRSILGQSFRDFELILVDDGSPDGCGALCDGYAREDRRVRVIHQKNGGLSAARNAGIDLALEGDAQWLTFIDSDDWVHREMLGAMLSAAGSLDTKISVCAYGETAGEDPWTGAPLEAEAWEPEPFYRQHFILATIACAKLYQRSLFEGLRYPLGKLHEDEFVTYRLLFTQEKLAVIFAPLYAYYQNDSGITKTNWTPRRLDAWEAYDQQIAFFRQLGREEMVRFRLRGFLENAMVNLNQAETSPRAREYRRTIRAMYRRIRRLLRQCWHGGCIRFWMDFDILVRFYPVTTRLYRLWLEGKEKLRRKGHG